MKSLHTKTIAASLEQLPARTIALLRTAGQVASWLQLPVYGAGGFVRDLLLGRKTRDVDLVVVGDGLEYAKHLARSLDGRLKIFPSFSTAKIMRKGAETIDVAVARSENYDQPGALPRVEAADLKTDMRRRDFTINAMAVRINPETFGALADYFGGLADLRSGHIKILHAESFRDDPTRIFRAVRFAERYHFQLERTTRHLLRAAIAEGLIGRLSSQRVSKELSLLLAEDRADAALARLDELGARPWVRPLHESWRRQGATAMSKRQQRAG